MFLHEPLRDWDVSRPAPYFGFEIPDAPGHYFYVWVDAPVGYMSATADWCDGPGRSFERWWQNRDLRDPPLHRQGHRLLPHALLAGDAARLGRPLPRQIHVNGFLTVNGEKMSKRKGTFVLARTYLDQLAPDYLRYYYASKLSGAVTDSTSTSPSSWPR